MEETLKEPKKSKKTDTTYNRLYYQAHKEQIKAAANRRYQERREEILAARKVWREAHPEKIKEYQERHRQKVAERQAGG